MNGALGQLEREAVRICDLLRRLEEIPVKEAARLLKKSPKWVRANLPIVVHGPRSSHVRAMDVEAYQLRRTVWPGKDFPRKISPERAESDSNPALSRSGAGGRSHIERMIRHAKRIEAR